MNQVLERMRNIVMRELDSIPDDPQLTYDCLCMIDKLVDIWKDSYEIEEKEQMMSSYEEGFSRGGYSMNNGYSNGNNRMMPRYYYDGNSYNGNGGYSNNGGGSYGRGGSYNGRGGYSREDAKHDMINKLENLMNETHDDQDREAIRRMLDGMR